MGSVGGGEHRSGGRALRGRVRLGRRRLLGLGLTGLAAAVWAGTGAGGPARVAVASEQHDESARQASRSQGRLSARPRPPADAWPTGDLALQASAADLFGFEKRPDSRTMLVLAEAWRPWRSIAARLLWAHYRSLKGLPQTVS